MATVERFSTHKIAVPVSQTDYVLGSPAGVGAAGGAAGDYLETVNVNVTDITQSLVNIKDGSGTAITIHPAAISAGKGIGAFPLWLGITSKTGPWKITTGSGVTVLACGTFT